MNITEQAVLEKIIYGDVFDWPLNYDELRTSENILNKLIKKNIIQEKNGFYFLAGKIGLVKKRIAGEKWAKEKFKIAIKAGNILKIIPSIILVGVSGGLAVGNCRKEDDIDFFTVCRTGSLWTTRFWATLILDIGGFRRRPGAKYFADKICLNMFVDEIGLAELKKEKDIYTRHELQQLKILWQRKNHPKKPAGFLENLLRQFQFGYMKNKITTEKIETHKLMFHPYDVKEKIIKEYKKKLLTLAKVI